VIPYYQDDAVTIWHGRAEDVLPGLEQVTLAITDPPYGTGAYATDTEPDYRVLAGSRAAVFGYPNTLFRWFAEMGDPAAWIVWWPTNGACRGSYHHPLVQRETEHIACWGELRGEARVPKSTRAIDPSKYSCLPDRKSPDVWRDAAPGLAFNARKRLHKNEKPLTVMSRLIRLFGGDDVIVDPFMGSGTTLRAAKDLGRRAIGIECVEAFCEIAAKRMAQEVLF